MQVAESGMLGPRLRRREVRGGAEGMRDAGAAPARLGGRSLGRAGGRGGRRRWDSQVGAGKVNCQQLRQRQQLLVVLGGIGAPGPAAWFSRSVRQQGGQGRAPAWRRSGGRARFGAAAGAGGGGRLAGIAALVLAKSMNKKQGCDKNTETDTYGTN